MTDCASCGYNSRPPFLPLGWRIDLLSCNPHHVPLSSTETHHDFSLPGRDLRGSLTRYPVVLLL